MNGVIHAMQRPGAGRGPVLPPKPSANRAIKPELGLKDDVLSDVGLTFSEAPGLVFDMPRRLQEVSASFGVDLGKANADGLCRLPMPARLTVDRNRKVLHADVRADCTIRPEPSATLSIIRNSGIHL